MNRKTILRFFCSILCITILSASAQSKADRILGVYSVTEPDSKEVSKVRIYKTTSGTYAGQVIWLKNPYFPNGTLKTDIKNPNPDKRNTPGDKILLMWNFIYDADNDQWISGEIYDPVHGKVYKCKMKFESDSKLMVRGYIGVPALGKSMYWYKIVN